MVEGSYFQTVGTDAPIRQGDIIRKDIVGDDIHSIWGVVITADCDIAQQKMGEFFTYLTARSTI
jgi:hypothetical protein